MARHTAFSSSTMATSLRSFTVPHSLIQGLGSHALTDLLLDFLKGDSSYSFEFNAMARPAELEPAPFCLERRRSTPEVHPSFGPEPNTRFYKEVGTCRSTFAVISLW
jgi:hypothetical protein